VNEISEEAVQKINSSTVAYFSQYLEVELNQICVKVEKVAVVVWMISFFQGNGQKKKKRDLQRWFMN
jgi:short-subunit dehydrogenase